MFEVIWFVSGGAGFEFGGGVCVLIFVFFSFLNILLLSVVRGYACGLMV